MAKFGLNMLVGPSAEPVSLAEAKAHLAVEVSTDDARISSLIVVARIMAEVQTRRQLVAAQWLLSWDGFYSENLLPRPGVMLSSLAGGLAGWADAWRVWQERGGGWGTMDIATIRTPGGKLQSVQSVVYVDTTGTLQTLPSAQYQVDTQQEPGRIVPAISFTWPTTQNQLNALQVAYTVGYPHTTSAASIPAGASQIVTPASMAAIQAPVAGLQPGSVLWVMGTENALEWVNVTAVTDTTFTATFALAHTGPVTISAVPETARQAILLMVGHWYLRREAVVPGQMTELPMGAGALLDTLWTGEMY